jgi:DCN1-like protein 4/5
MPRAAGKPARKKAKAAPKKAKAAPKKAKAAPKAVPKAKETVESLFERFCSAQDDSSAAGVEGQTRIGPEGIEAWTGALGVEPSDRRVLLFCWHARAAQMGYFTKEEWSRGFAASHAKTMAGLKRGLKTLDRTVEDPDDFEEFFEYAFDYCLTEPGQKILDKDTAAAMLQVCQWCPLQQTRFASRPAHPARHSHPLFFHAAALGCGQGRV